jgi:hypothetical protein
MNKILTSLVIVALVSAMFLHLDPVRKVNADGESWLTGWGYRKSHLLVHSSVAAGTNYQFNINVYNTTGSDSGANVYLGSKCQANFGDVRFTSHDGNTLLDYWIEGYYATYASFWVEVADTLSGVDATIYIYYGNSTVSTTSNGDNTFNFFDDFSSASINGTKWGVTYGSPAQSGGILTIAGVSTSEGVMSNWTTYGNFTYKALRFRQRVWTFSTLIDCGFSSDIVGGATPSERWLGYSSNTTKILSSNTTSYSLTQVSAAVSSAWHTYDILWNSSRAEFYNDANLTAHSYPSNYICATAKPVLLYWYYSAANANYDVDYVFVRNYVGNEPTHGAWGSEESTGVLTVHLYIDYFGDRNFYATFAYNGSGLANETTLTFTNSTTTLRLETHPQIGYCGNIFDDWYINGTAVNLLVGDNPYLLLINANYDIIANWTQEVMIEPRFTMNTTTINENGTILFDSAESTAVLGIQYCTWKWNDGTSDEYTSPPTTTITHKFTTAGVYNVTLVIADNNDYEKSTTFYSIIVSVAVETPETYIGYGLILSLCLCGGLGMVFIKHRTENT